MKEESKWRFQVGSTWCRGSQTKCINAYRKNAKEYVECGSTTENGNCAGYFTISDCNNNSRNLKSSTYQSNKSNTNPTFGTDMNHWCTLNYEELTKAGY